MRLRVSGGRREGRRASKRPRVAGYSRRRGIGALRGSWSPFPAGAGFLRRPWAPERLSEALSGSWSDSGSRRRFADPAEPLRGSQSLLGRFPVSGTRGGRFDGLLECSVLYRNRAGEGRRRLGGEFEAAAAGGAGLGRPCGLGDAAVTPARWARDPGGVGDRGIRPLRGPFVQVTAGADRMERG